VSREELGVRSDEDPKQFPPNHNLSSVICHLSSEKAASVWGKAIGALRTSREPMLQMMCGEYTEAAGIENGELIVAADSLALPLLRENIGKLNDALKMSGLTVRVIERKPAADSSDEERIKMLLGNVPFKIV